MKYKSTRGGVKGLSFEEAVLSGLASDRGLMVPMNLPPADVFANQAKKWRELSYAELAVEVMSLFIDPAEISRKDLAEIVNKSYNSSTFRNSEITPVVDVTENIYVMEMFHGPTFAFKDVALQFLGNLFEFFLERKNKTKPVDQQHQITVVGATSGDTGSSAIYGLRKKKNIEVFIMYPNGRVSDIQEKQMATVLDDNIHNISVKGTFDDCQAHVKDLFADADFKAKYNLGAVNSINWARILAQIVYYVYAYLRVSTNTVNSRKESSNASKSFKKAKISFSVPTGNFGDILAGFYARRLGVPIADLIVATNENDILHRFFENGTYHREPINHTISPSMDICVSSNFERFLYALAGNDSVTLKQWMSKFEENGELTLSGKFLKNAQKEMSSFRVPENDVISTIKKFQTEHNYLLDPHSAIGADAATQYLKRKKDNGEEIENEIVVVVGTAHYGKFLPTVNQAIGSSAEQHPILAKLDNLPTRSHVKNNSITEIKHFIVETVRKRSGAPSDGCNPVEAQSYQNIAFGIAIASVAALVIHKYWK